MRKEQIELLINTSKSRVRALLVVHCILLVIWLNASVVPGFANVMVEENGFNAVSHIGFWTVIEVLTLFVGAMAKSYLTLSFFIGLLVIAIVANIVHIVGCIFELIRCTTVLCMGNKGFLVALIVILSVLIVVEVVQIYYTSKHKQYLKNKKNR